MSNNIIGNSVNFVRKTGLATDKVQIGGNPLKFNNSIELDTLVTDTIDSGADVDLVLKRNGTALISLTEDASGVAYIDMNNKVLKNVVLTEVSNNVVVNDSIELGVGSGVTLATTGTPSTNLVLNVPTGKQINMSVNNTAQAYVNANGLTIPSGSLYIAGNGYNISQLSGNGLYRCPAGTSHQFQVNGSDILTANGTTLTSVGTSTVLGSGNASALTIAQDGTNTTYNVPTSKIHKFQVNGSDVLTASGTALTSLNTSTVLGSGNASAVTITQDGTNTIYNVPTSKKHKFQANGVDVLTIDGNYTTGNLMILGQGGSNPTSTAASCGLRSTNGICASNDLYIGGQVKAEMGFGSGNGLITSNASSDATLQLSTGTTSNTRSIFNMKPNFTGTILSGFNLKAEYGDNSSNNNRYNSTLFVEQYITSVNGGSSINAFEKRMTFGAIRDIKFSTTGSSTNDIVFDGNNASFNGVNVVVGSGRSLTMTSDSAFKPSGGTWSVSSDVRLKENIEDVKTKDALNVINSIRLRYFDYVDDFNKKYSLPTHKKVGIVAQELEQHDLLKPCVFVGDDEVFYENKEEEYYDDIECVTKTRVVEVEKQRITNRKQVNMDRVYHFMIGAIQELNKQNNYLLTKLKDKENQMLEINERLNALENNVQTAVNVDTFDSVSYSGNVPDNFSALG